MWWAPLTNQKPPRPIDQSQLLCAPLGHGGGTEGEGKGCRGGVEGHRGGMEGCTEGWLPLATINLVGDNREFEV